VGNRQFQVGNLQRELAEKQIKLGDTQRQLAQENKGLSVVMLVSIISQ